MLLACRPRNCGALHSGHRASQAALDPGAHNTIAMPDGKPAGTRFAARSPCPAPPGAIPRCPARRAHAPLGCAPRPPTASLAAATAQAGANPAARIFSVAYDEAARAWNGPAHRSQRSGATGVPASSPIVCLGTPSQLPPCRLRTFSPAGCCTCTVQWPRCGLPTRKRPRGWARRCGAAAAPTPPRSRQTCRQGLPHPQCMLAPQTRSVAHGAVLHCRRVYCIRNEKAYRASLSSRTSLTIRRCQSPPSAS